MTRSWSSCMVIVLTVLVVGARGSGSELPSWLGCVTEDEMRSAPRHRSPSGPVQLEISSADDVDPKVLLGEAAVQATMARDFLKSVIQDAVPILAEPDRYSKIRIERSFQEVVEHIAPMMIPDAFDFLSWVYSHSIMASVQSWIAAAEQGDAFSITQIVYELVKNAQGEVIDAARYDERTCNFVIEEEPGSMTWGILALPSRARRRQNRGQETMILTFEMAKDYLPPDVYMLYVMTMSDPTDIDTINNMISSARVLEGTDALSYRLFLCVEQLAHYTAVLGALFPLIHNDARYVEIGKPSESNPYVKMMSDLRDQFAGTYPAFEDYVNEVDYYRHSCYTIRDWMDPIKRIETVKATMRAAMKAAAERVFEFPVDDDLTTPLFPLKETTPVSLLNEPTPLSPLNEPKTRKKKAKKTKKKRRQPEIDAGLYAMGMGSESTSLGVSDAQSSFWDDSGAVQGSCEVGEYVQQAPEGVGGHGSDEDRVYVHQAYEDGQASYATVDSALHAFEDLTMADERLSSITHTSLTDDQYGSSCSGPSSLPAGGGRRSRRKAVDAERRRQEVAVVAPTLTTLLEDLPTKFDKFVTAMSACFAMRQSATGGTFHFWDKETGKSVVTVHRPHGNRHTEFRPDVMYRIHGAIRAFEVWRRSLNAN